MTPEQLTELKTDLSTHLEDVVQRKVNGKIDKIQAHLEKQDTTLEDLGKQIATLKFDTDPIVKTRKNFEWLGDLGKSFAGWIILIGSVGAVVYGGWVFLKDNLSK